MKMPMLLWGSLICLAAGAPAFAQTPVAATTPTDASPTPTADYQIGPEDVLDIAVWNNPAMSRTTPVRPDGMISLPLLNDIQAAGLTPMQLRNNIATKLTEYLPNPEVSVIVRDPVTVMTVSSSSAGGSAVCADV